MGFIKLDRKFKDWKWKHNPNMVAVWVHLLLEANYKDNVWNDVSVPVGSLVTSVKQDYLSNKQELAYLTYNQQTK